MITSENLRQVKEMITQPAFYCIMFISSYYKMIVIDLSKQQALDADPEAIQQISFTRNLGREGNTKMLFIIEKEKEAILDFSQGTVRAL